MTVFWNPDNRLNSYMHRKLKLASKPTCPCGQEYQTTEHVQQRYSPPPHPLFTKLFYSILGCVLPLLEEHSARVLQLSLSFAILFHIAPCCPTISSLQQLFCLPADLMPFICHSMLLTVHLLSFIWVMCLASFHFAFVTYLTMSVTLVLCPMIVLQILYWCFCNTPCLASIWHCW